MHNVQFTFRPKWKEELFCESELGTFVLVFTMGVRTVYFPAADHWARVCPPWATDLWETVHFQLTDWCEENRIPLVIDDVSEVYTG